MQEHGDDPGWDAVEAGNLYDLLEQQVVPDFYSRDKNGIPVKWIEKMRKSMATLTPRFSANRVVREYTEKYYLPAAANYKKRAEDKGALAKKIIHTMNDIKNKWEQIHFGETAIENVEGGYEFKIFIRLNGIQPEQVAVELYAEGMNGAAPEIIKMETETSQNVENYVFHAIIKTKRKAADYTARIKPCYEGISTPLEDNRILWQR